MIALGLIGVVDQGRVERAINEIIGYILTSYDWSFICEEKDIDVSSATDIYDLADNFLKFTDEKLIYYKNGLITLTTEEYVRTLYQNLDDLGELKYAVVKGKDKIKFYSVTSLTGSVTVTYSYHKVGTSSDLDVDKGFIEIIKQGSIKNLAKIGSQEQLSAQAIFYANLTDKQQRWKRAFGGESKFSANDHTKAFQQTRTDIRLG